MEKYNWKEDTELLIALSERGTAPVAVPKPLFYSQYEFVIQRTTKPYTVVKKFVPEWCVDVVSKMLDQDETVKRYSFRMTYKGNKK